MPSEEGREILHLERSSTSPGLFLGFRITGTKPSDVSAVSGIDGKPVVFEGGHIRRITDTLIQPLPHFSPEDAIDETQRKLAELKARALGWHSVDSITTPLGPNKQLTVEKHAVQPSQPPDTQSTSKGSSLVLRVIRERFLPSGRRKQLTVEFHGNDYFMQEPAIAERILRPAQDSPSGYIIENRYEPPSTPAEKFELMQSITALLLDDLSK